MTHNGKTRYFLAKKDDKGQFVPPIKEMTKQAHDLAVNAKLDPSKRNPRNRVIFPREYWHSYTEPFTLEQLKDPRYIHFMDSKIRVQLIAELEAKATADLFTKEKKKEVTNG